MTKDRQKEINGQPNRKTEGQTNMNRQTGRKIGRHINSQRTRTDRQLNVYTQAISRTKLYTDINSETNKDRQIGN